MSIFSTFCVNSIVTCNGKITMSAREKSCALTVAELLLSCELTTSLVSRHR